MGDSTIRIVRADGLMLIGEYQMGTLTAPRVIGQQPQPDGRQRLVFVQLVGLPEQIQLPVSAMMWEPEEDDLVTAYKESVTGLVLTRAANVIPIGRA
ncbi:MAG: hypothetical protein ABIJ57_09550 [Pseudomonadota bacterium]|uniref:Uncharacterized protein n=1 Tax=viral metagenome TaxID=1070528 RepID=A0A6M3J643_9ZZZZ